MNPAKRVAYVADPNKFDLQVHAWDGQGKLVKENHYRLHIIEGRSYFERPVNSGNLWYENNQPAGRMEYTFGENGTIASKSLQLGAAHKEWKKPLTGAEALHFELEQTKERNAQLEAELTAIKAESEKKSAPKTVPNLAPQSSATGEAPKLTKRG